MPAPLELDAATARRFLVRRQLLSPPRALKAEPASVLEVVRRLGSLQFDPLEIPGARNHDLVLHARIAGYQRAWCEGWLYPERPQARRLIELYNKSLNLLPVEELPYYRIIWEEAAARYDQGVLTTHGEVAQAILDGLDEAGPQTTAAFGELGGSIDWWWAKTKVARVVMEAMFVTGRLGIARREGNRRFYDRLERLVPPALLAQKVSSEDAHRHRLLSRFRGVGLMGESASRELLWGTVPAAERRAIISRLVEEGVLLPAKVEGLKGTRYLLAEERRLLAAPRKVAVPEVSLIAPLDPLLWDRRLLRTLFGYDYVWEVYTPVHKRRFGHYVLPLLFGDRLVGRIEPRFDRTRGTLGIQGIWFEEGFDPLKAEGFTEALSRALGDYVRFVGARRVTWPRTKSGRALAARVVLSGA
jgi:uncharacterized protein YcaQ